MTTDADKSVIDDDVNALHQMGYAQELARSMHGFSNFAISFSIICILAGGVTAFPIAFSSGGAFQATIGWVVGGVFALIVAAGLGQIASAYPTAGGLYHWSSILGGRGWGWATAWINMLGLIFVIASVNVGVYLLARDMVIAPIFGVDVSGWGYGTQLTAVVFITTTQALFNTFGIKLTTALTDFSGYLIFVVAALLTGVMFIYGATFDLSRIFTFTNNTGDLGGGFFPDARSGLVAFLVGMLYPLYTMTGYDASAHTAEETVDARRAVPRGMLYSVFWSLLFGFVLAVSFVLAMPDTAAGAKDGGNVFFNLFNSLPAPVWIKDLIAIGIVLANYFCALAGLTSTSRMIYAFARDGGLPGSKLFRHVSPSYRTPIPAIWLTCLLSIAATIYSAAFAALAAGCALFLYISYAMPIAAGACAEGKTWTTFGPFRLGALSKPFALITVVGVILLCYAGIQPPNDILINYAVGALVLLIVGWFGHERRRFSGPPIGGEIKTRKAEIIAEERAVGEA